MLKQQTSPTVHPEPELTQPTSTTSSTSSSIKVKTSNEPKEIRYGSFLVGNGNCSIS